MIKYFCILLFLISNVAKGQRKSYPFQLVDRFCNCPEFDWNGNNFELKDIHKSINDIEIRLTVTSPGIDKAITVLTLENGNFDAFYYNRRLSHYINADSLNKYKKWEKYAGQKFQIPKKGLDSVFREMAYHKIFTLQNQKEVYKGYFLSTFKMEVKLNNHFNTYVFGPPDSPADAKNKVLLDYTVLEQIFNTLTNKYFNQVRRSR